MVENFVRTQIVSPENFVLQDFTIRAAPGLSGPTNTHILYMYFRKLNNFYQSGPELFGPGRPV